MEKIFLKKNRLDKEFDFETKKAMGWFTLGTVTFIGFVTGSVIAKQYVFAGVFGFVIMVLSIYFFRKKQKRIDEILKSIEKLK